MTIYIQVKNSSSIAFYFIVCKNAFILVFFTFYLMDWQKFQTINSNILYFMGATVYVNNTVMHSPKETVMSKLSWLFWLFKISNLILIFVYFDPSLGHYLIKYQESGDECLLDKLFVTAEFIRICPLSSLLSFLCTSEYELEQCWWMILTKT